MLNCGNPVYLETVVALAFPDVARPWLYDKSRLATLVSVSRLCLTSELYDYHIFLGSSFFDTSVIIVLLPLHTELKSSDSYVGLMPAWYY